MPSTAAPPVASSTTIDLLRDAVHQHRRTSRRGLLERLFTLWFRGFVYHQIWEDPRIDAHDVAINVQPAISCQIGLHDLLRQSACDLV